MPHFTRPWRLAPLAAAVATVCALPAQAQTAETGKLQTVTVTAERRVENAQQVPNSISVLNSELLDALNTSGQDVRMLAGREIPVLYWRYGKEAVLASLPALAIGLAAANWLGGSPSWAAAALALAIYGGSWLGFGGVAASQQLLRGRS